LNENNLGEYASEEMRFRAIEANIEKLNIYAPHDGVISDLPAGLHAGRYVQTSKRLMRIVSPNARNLIALPNDSDAARLSKGAAFTFIGDDASAQPIKGHLTALTPTNEAVITDRLLTSITGGHLAVHSDKNGQLIAHTPVVKVQGLANTDDYLTRAQRGVVQIKAEPQSPASALWRSVVRVLIRETDF